MYDNYVIKIFQNKEEIGILDAPQECTKEDVLDMVETSVLDKDGIVILRDESDIFILNPLNGPIHVRVIGY